MWMMDESKFLTPPEIRHLRATLSELARTGKRRSRVRWMTVDLGLNSGLRVSEMANLRIEHLRIARGQNSIVVVNGKGGKTANVVINDKLKRHFRDFIDWRGTEEGHLLLNEKGLPYTRIGLYKMIKKVFRDLGLPERYSPHSLRHTFASSLYRVTKDLRLVMRQCRHSSPNVTAVYANLLDDEIKDGVERMYE